MNIRKNIDYSAMFAAMDTAMATGMSQMELYCQLGALVCERPEKGAAVAAAEYLKNRYQDVSGFSPRNLRRMRDFYRMYGGKPELLKLAMEIGWTHNVVILEAELNLEERRWYLRAAQQFGWSKADLQKKIAAEAHLELLLDESKVPCYTECEDSKLECSKHDQDTFPLPWQHLQKPDGRVHYEGSGEEGQSGAEHSDLVSSHQHRGDRQSGVSAGSPQAVRAWHRLLWQKGPSTSEQRLREIRPSDWHGSCQPAEYVPHLRRRFCRQDASADGLYQPSRRGSRSMVHRGFRYDLAGCRGRLPGTSSKNNQQGCVSAWKNWLSGEPRSVYNGIPAGMTLSA